MANFINRVKGKSFNRVKEIQQLIYEKACLLWSQTFEFKAGQS